MKEDTTIKSPFKFLDSYSKSDRDIYFGRDAEIEELYDRIFESNLILLYGESGTGKTSLINCGLANQFDERDWLPVYIRRSENMLDSLSQALTQAAATPIPPELPLRKKIRSLYLDFYKPIYLVFDQFEEIFILGTEEEQIQFFEAIKEILLSEIQCKMLLSMRGEYLDKLSKYELVIPSLFDNRLYLERMSRRNLQEVVRHTTAYFQIELEEEDLCVKQIIDNITDTEGGVELANLQIYLDKLYRSDLERRGDDPRALRFDAELLKQNRQLEDVLADFLEEQLQTLETELSQKGVQQKGIPLDVLFALVTEEGTKKSLVIELLKNQLQKRKKIKADIVDYCLHRFQDLKIVRLLGDD